MYYLFSSMKHEKRYEVQGVVKTPMGNETVYWNSFKAKKSALKHGDRLFNSGKYYSVWIEEWDECDDIVAQWCGYEFDDKITLIYSV